MPTGMADMWSASHQIYLYKSFDAFLDKIDGSPVVACFLFLE